MYLSWQIRAFIAATIANIRILWYSINIRRNSAGVSSLTVQRDLFGKVFFFFKKSSKKAQV